VVLAIHQDRYGYVWLAATDGLARFDGNRFTSYDRRDGLPAATVTAIAEDRQGRLWVGTNGAGVARLVDIDPASAPARGDEGEPQPKFAVSLVGESEEANRVSRLAFAPDGALFCLAGDGLYRCDPRTRRFTRVLRPRPASRTAAILVDRRGRFWLALDGAVVLLEGGRTTRFDPPGRVGDGHVHAVVEDSRGRIVIGCAEGLLEYQPPGAGRGTWRRLPLALAPQQEIRSMWAARDGVLWIGTTHGLVRWVDGAQTLYTTANGLRNDVIRSLSEDREGNLWVGTNGGPSRLAAGHMTRWTVRDGLPDAQVEKVVEGRDGRIYVRTLFGGFAEIVGGRAVLLPGSRRPWLNRNMNSQMSAQVLQDRHGDWWVMTRTQVMRFRGPALRFRAGEPFGAAHGLPEGTRFSGALRGIYEDAGGHIWLAGGRGLFRSEAPRRGPPSFATLPLVGFGETDEVNDLVEDRSGSIWFRTHRDLARVVDGRIERLLRDEWRPAAAPRCLFVDSRGRLWAGLRHRGLWVTADPGAKTPEWTRYSVEDGLSSDNVNALAEDHRGRIYAGTTRGLDRLDPASGRIRTYTSRDGLAGGYVTDVTTDRQGRLWVATTTGLTRIDLAREPEDAPPPPALFTGLHVAGEELALPERGVREIPGLRLGPSSNNLLIEFVAVGSRDDVPLRYQHRLEGVDRDWSAPSDQRAVAFGRLAPGDYRFLVRSVTPEGNASQEPAVLSLRIAPPFWHRGWFFAAAAAALGMIAELVHRFRLRRRLELEAVRTRIATDLHDDIGSNLCRIAILTEVARQHLDGTSPTVKAHLEHIASVSRDLVDSVSEIVWAVNPARDRLRDLTRRMRRFADDVLSARDIALRFRVPSDGDDLPLSAHVRREIFLVFKESIHNAARHSRCRNAEVALDVDGGWLRLRVKDDGRGFDPAGAGADGNGSGLASMKRRAENLGGTLTVVSGPGEGTTLGLWIPLRRPGSVDRLLERALPSRRGRSFGRGRATKGPGDAPARPPGECPVARPVDQA
jgi:signal transduction histidine kinase/ligand-binding sensor domain-containing protein